MTTRRALALLVFAAILSIPVALAPRFGLATAVVRRGPIRDRVILRAVVVAARGVAEVSAPVAEVSASNYGRVQKVLVREGDKVTAGQTLAELEPALKTGTPVLVTAPIAGNVLARRLDPGDSVAVASQAGTRALFEIADTDASEVRAEIEERDLARVRVGLEAKLTAPGGGRAIAIGTITRVAAQLERRTIGADDARVRADGLVRAAWISWRGAAPAVVLGEEVEAELALPAKPDALHVPRRALVVRDGRTVVETPFLLWSRELPVTVRAADDGSAEVEGVAEGTVVYLH